LLFNGHLMVFLILYKAGVILKEMIVITMLY